MADFVKKEQLNGSQKVVVGDRYNDLVLRTLGRVYIQTGSKFTLLTEYLDKVTNEKAGNKILVWNDESELTDIRYPGDGYFIFISSTKDLYITFAGGYVPLIIAGTSSLDWEALNKRFLSTSGGDVDNYVRVNGELIAEKGKFSDQVEITSRKPPLKVISKELVKNFNSEYIGGYNESEVGIKVRDEGITGQWKFNNVTTFNDMVRYSGKLVDSSGFVPGFTGYGWMLDTETCTLTVDNLIVRRIMNVYELVVNKISATNGSLWVSDSAKVKSTNIIEPGHELYSLRESSEFESNHSYPQYNSSTDSNDMINIYNAYFPGDFYHIVLEEDYNPFRMNDLLRCQRFTGTSIKYYDAIVTNIISSNELMIRLSNSLNDTYNVVEGDVVTNKPQNQYEVNENGETIEISSTTFDKSLTEPAEGDGLVRIGSTARRDRQGAIYITSNDVSSPYIDILDGVHLPNFNKIIKYKDNNGKLVTHKCLKVRLGNLSGIYDPDFVTQPHGYGLYADNVFIKGRFMQVNNSGVSTPIPVYRGEWNATTDYYKDDQVTFDNQLYGATKDNKNNSPELLNAWKIIISKGEDGASAYSLNATNDNFSISEKDLDNSIAQVSSNTIELLLGSQMISNFDISVSNVINCTIETSNKTITVTKVTDINDLNLSYVVTASLNGISLGTIKCTGTINKIPNTYALICLPSSLNDSNNSSFEAKVIKYVADGTEYVTDLSLEKLSIKAEVKNPTSTVPIQSMTSLVNFNTLINEKIQENKKLMTSLDVTLEYNDLTEKIFIDSETINYTRDGKDGNDGNDGKPGNGIENIVGYYLLTDVKTGVTHDTPGWTTTPGDLDSVNRYLWKYEVVTYTNGTSVRTNPLLIGTHGEDGLPGGQGDPGPAGPSLTFFGKYNPLETAYPLKPDNRVVVYVLSHSGENKEYFQTKLLSFPVNVPAGSNLPDPAYWEPFGGNFQSIATGTLLAEGANIANFIFNGGVMESQSKTILNGKEVPVLRIDGTKGKIEAQDGLFRGIIEAKSGSFGDSKTGEIFKIEGNSILGNAINENGDLSTRIKITTDKLPSLESFHQGTNVQSIPTAAGSYYTDEVGFTPEGDLLNNYDRAIGFNGWRKNGQHTLTEFEIPKGLYNTRIIKIDVSMTEEYSSDGSVGGTAVSKRCRVFLQKKSGTSFIDIELKTGINYINVKEAEVYRILIEYNEFYTQYYFDRYPRFNPYLYVDGPVGPDSIYVNWPYKVLQGGNAREYTPIYIGNTGATISSVSVFDGISQTVIANDGFCSYWGPNTYFYFSKSTGLLQATKPVESEEIVTTKSEIKILTIDDVKNNNYPEGLIYKDENGFLKVT